MQMDISVFVTSALVPGALYDPFAKGKFTCSLTSHDLYLYIQKSMVYTKQYLFDCNRLTKQ
jgi:hypothetical protein